MSHKNNTERHRLHLIQAAARIMAEEGVADFLLAKQKAAQRLGWNKLRALPSNREVEQALRDYQQLFQATIQRSQLRALRTTALEAMQFLAPFTPRLVGSVLSGSACAHDPIDLHIFAPSSEAVLLFLQEYRIPFSQTERSVRFGREPAERFPLLRFVAGETYIEMTIFPSNGLRRTPLSTVDARPMQRADTQAVLRLLAATSGE
jgi:hypothetical protein